MEIDGVNSRARRQHRGSAVLKISGLEEQTSSNPLSVAWYANMIRLDHRLLTVQDILDLNVGAFNRAHPALDHLLDVFLALIGSTSIESVLLLCGRVFGENESHASFQRAI